MITLGAVLGKCNLTQMFILVLWEMFWYGLNEAICVEQFGMFDAGGAIRISIFGSAFGLAAGYFFQPTRAGKSNNCKNGYYSEVTACLGALFLFLYWPSFNAALLTGHAKERAVVNTLLSLSASTMGAIGVSRYMFGKLDMEIVLNASLAGGVAMAAACDLITQPWAAMLVGLLAGMFSAISFQSWGPYFAEKANLQDTCGVFSVHLVPGIFGGIVSAAAVGSLEDRGFDRPYVITGTTM